MQRTSVSEAFLKAARAAGAAGEGWNRWIMSDEAQDAIIAVEHWTDADEEAIKNAFNEGRRASSIARGRIVWTTASRDYDGADATELEVLGDYHGRTLRKVAIDPEGYDWQTSRYASGTHGVWDRDPMEEERQVREKYAKLDAERAAAKAKRAAGVEWLQTATERELDDEDLCERHGVTWQDVREERRRRQAAEQETGRTSEWARASSLIPEGVTLIDDGAYIPGRYGLNPIHRPARVFYDVKIVRGWPDDVKHAQVHAATGKASKPIGSVADIAERIAKKDLRIAKANEVPPRVVVDRIGQDQWKQIRAVNVGGRTVWVGRPTFGSAELVLDEQGRLVRSQKVADAAKAAAR